LKNILPQQYGSLLEYYIIKKEKTKKNREHGSGDCIKDGIDYEIRVSISSNNGFTYDQIRLNRKVNYLLYGYSLNEGNVDRLGELFKFKMTHDEMKDLISKYGTFRGVTKKEIGESISESLEENDESSTSNNNRLVYKLHTYPNSSSWKEMLEKYLVK
jgi:hypothetical protein